MSGTTYLHGVYRDLVIETLPVNTTTISATSNGLNFGQIDNSIARAAGMVNAQLVRHGIEPSSLDFNTSQLAQDAIISYSAAFCLECLGASPDKIERRFGEWKSLFKQITEQPQILGSAQDTAATSVVKSNINASCPTRSKWRSGSFRF